MFQIQQLLELSPKQSQLTVVGTRFGLHVELKLQSFDR